MPVEVSEIGAGAFIAVFVAALIIAAALYARHHGHLRNKKTGMIIAAVVGIAIAYSLTSVFFS
jgi:hypothetical protein